MKIQTSQGSFVEIMDLANYDALLMMLFVMSCLILYFAHFPISIQKEKYDSCLNLNQTRMNINLE